MTKVFCDRCGKEVDNLSYTFIARNNIFFELNKITVDCNSERVSKKVDLCDDCTEKLKDWLTLK